MEKFAIICVDDEGVVLESLTEQLKRHLDVLEIEAAESGEEALEVLAELSQEDIEVALIISDQIMPRMKGDEFLIKVHHQYPDICKIMMTGQADVDAIGNVVNKANLYRYIQKPWDETDLILTVKEAIKSFQQERQLQEQNKRLRQLNTQLEQRVEERTAELQSQVVALQEAQHKILELNQQLEELSYLDGLTGIANRRFFDEMLTKEWERACREQFSLGLLLIDVDFFKKYNDHYGHPQGDECLKKVAQAIKSISRNCRGALAARYGGEEFVVLLSEADIHDVYGIAERLLEEIATLKIPHALSDVSEYVTLSIGVCVDMPNGSQGFDDFISKADQYLYQAKKQGRSQVCGH